LADREITVRERINSVRGRVFTSEDHDVRPHLITPILDGLGWDVTTLASPRTTLRTDLCAPDRWNQRYTIRDYILHCAGREVLHVEAKLRWEGWEDVPKPIDVEDYLDRINLDDWSDTYPNGPKKDLALVIYGASARGVNRVALMDERRLLVLDREVTWKVKGQADVFGDFELLWPVLRLLAPQSFA